MDDKIHVILDTDTANECDDQFALAYLLTNQDRLSIDAITTAPFSHRNEDIVSGQAKSIAEVNKICQWLDFDTTNKVFQGALDYTDQGFTNNSAVEKIIETAKTNSLTYLIAIGAPTNIATAIHYYPEIIRKIELIWLGSNGPMQTENLDFNFRQDLAAVRTIFNSKLKMTVIPCKNVAALLMTSIYELQHHLGGKSELCDYLLERFYNDTYHGIQERRVIWDISAVAYLLHPEWFTVQKLIRPKINDDTSFDFTINQDAIYFVTNLDTNQIFTDLWTRLASYQK